MINYACSSTEVTPPIHRADFSEDKSNSIRNPQSSAVLPATYSRYIANIQEGLLDTQSVSLIRISIKFILITSRKYNKAQN
ncbi:hypothetical protein AYI69_g10894 [Smittium culicis]|uniref:Uncharacterized protein n=1 Tax=Smittium culicis TaxID=133412 RepID=A0A1R1X2T3_9FUNG|nr:hypothetical protein AYI69_g10894 [Smittium culicis]